MLRGKILSLEYRDNAWNTDIAGVKRTFSDLSQLEAYLYKALTQGKDPQKRALLAEDLRHWMRVEG